jgi:lipopolysaccharide transport protein LptA
MKSCVWQWLIIGALAAGAALGQSGDTAAAGATEITSGKLVFDYKNHFALFEDNVVVKDPRLKLTADKLTVLFDEGGNAKSIKAEGHVTITQEDKKATSEKALYDVDTGEIVLEGRPRVIRGRDTLEGEKITFWRDQNKLICTPGARLLLYPEKGGAREKVLGE